MTPVKNLVYHRPETVPLISYRLVTKRGTVREFPQTVLSQGTPASHTLGKQGEIGWSPVAVLECRSGSQFREIHYLDDYPLYGPE